MVAPVVAGILKGLAANGLSILASAVAAKGKESIESKLGVDIDSALGSEEGRIKLRELEIEHQEFLINAAQATEARNLEWFREEVKDRNAARERDASFLVAGKTNWRGHVMFVIAVAFIAGLVWMVWQNQDLNESTKGIVTLLLGKFTGYLDNIYNFEFGTSRGSQNKDRTIEELVRK